MKRLLLSLIAIPLFTAIAKPVLADAIPYPNPGVIAPQVATYASGSGGINVYYYGSTANYTDYVGVTDLQTGYTSGEILDNHATAPGTMLSLGSGGKINAGDQLVFDIYSPEGLFASVAKDSDDGVNHGYITDFSGGTLNNVTIPKGIFVGLEDQAAFHSDFNYNDDTFVFTGVSAPSVAVTPEPSSLALLGTGLVSLGGLVRRRFLHV